LQLPNFKTSKIPNKMKLKFILFLLPVMLVMSKSYGQYSVTTGGQKYTLVEEATGPGCGYCPDGAQDIEQAIEPVYPRAVIASWHGAYYDATSMVVSGDPFCGGTPYVLGFPAAAIDRTVYLDVHESSPAMAVGLNRPWENWVALRNALTPNFDVSMKCLYVHPTSAHPDTGTITITVTGKSLSSQTGTWNMNVFITEDSISSAIGNFQQHSYMNSPSYGPCCDGSPCWFTGLCSSPCPGYPCSSCAVLPAADYSHMNVVRAALAAGGSIFGDAAFTNPASGATFTKTYTFTFDTTKFNPHFLKVMSLIQKPGPASATAGNTIENVIQAKVRLMPATLAATGVTETSKAMTDVTLYPNPAKNSITVKGVLNVPSDTRIEIINSVGQVVLSKSYAAGGSIFGEAIEITTLANGEYFMNIYNSGEQVSKKFVVSK
jgi:hypothetical protein